jgi:malate synthase
MSVANLSERKLSLNTKISNFYFIMVEGTGCKELMREYIIQAAEDLATIRIIIQEMKHE